MNHNYFVICGALCIAASEEKRDASQRAPALESTFILCARDRFRWKKCGYIWSNLRAMKRPGLPVHFNKLLCRLATERALGVI
jgi:hypothetical protein